MSEETFLRLSRRFFSNPLWEEPRVFSRAEAWLDCLRTAAWEEQRKLVAGNMVEVKRGGLVASVRYLSDRWMWSKTKVCSFLDLLEKEEMVTREKGQGISVIYLCNFDRYNPKKGHTEDTGRTPEGRIVEAKKESPPAREWPVLPTLDQAKAYAPTAGIDPHAAECWWLDCEGRGVSLNGYFQDAKGNEIRNWHSAMTSYGRKWQSNDARATQRNTKNGTHPQPPSTRNVGHNANVSYANRPKAPRPEAGHDGAEDGNVQ